MHSNVHYVLLQFILRKRHCNQSKCNWLMSNVLSVIYAINTLITQKYATISDVILKRRKNLVRHFHFVNIRPNTFIDTNQTKMKRIKRYLIRKIKIKGFPMKKYR
jgi:hypothetical protein